MKSGWWDSNPRHQPWQGCALPLSYIRDDFRERMMGFEPTTSTLARLRSTTELHPRVAFSLSLRFRCGVKAGLLYLFFCWTQAFFWRKFNLMVERSLRMGCMMLKIPYFRERREKCGRACQNASLQAAMRNLGTSKNSKWRFVGMQISEVRMQNWEFACGGCRTCKQNYLRNLR